MTSHQDNRMLSDFGFRDLNHLQKFSKVKLWERSQIYQFQWRVKMMTKYRGVNTAVKKEIEIFHKEYEDYLFRNPKGYPAVWTKNAAGQFKYLFEKLEKPWKLIKHGGSLFSISDPHGVLWFRAISSDELIIALDICFEESQKNSTRCKPAELLLSWQECKNAYSVKKPAYSPFLKNKEYDIALLICDNVDSTWDSQTGEWKPWSNPWSKAAYQKLSKLKSEDAVNQQNMRYVKNFSVSDKLIKDADSQKVSFDEMVNFVFYEGLAEMQNAASVLYLAFATENTRSSAIINDFYELHRISKWWK